MPDDIAPGSKAYSTGINGFWIYLYENNDVPGGISSQIKNKKLISFEYWKTNEGDYGNITAYLYESDTQVAGTSGNSATFTDNLSQVSETNQLIEVSGTCNSNNEDCEYEGWRKLDFITPHIIHEDKYYYITLVREGNDNSISASAYFNFDPPPEWNGAVPPSAAAHGGDPVGGEVWGGIGGHSAWPLHKLHFEVCE